MVKVSHEDAVVTTSQSATDPLQDFLVQRHDRLRWSRTWRVFRELHRYFVEVERAVLAEEQAAEAGNATYSVSYNP